MQRLRARVVFYPTVGARSLARCCPSMDRQTRQGHGLWPGIGGWWGLGARPLARCCARGLWPGTPRSGLGPGFDATASGQVLGAAASGSDATQRLRARVGRFFIPQLAHGIWPGVAQTWTAPPPAKMLGFKVFRGERLHRQTRRGHGLWPGIGGWWELGARPLARCCAHGFWPGT